MFYNHPSPRPVKIKHKKYLHLYASVDMYASVHGTNASLQLMKLSWISFPLLLNSVQYCPKNIDTAIFFFGVERSEWRVITSNIMKL